MGTTTNHLLPYPEPSASVDIPRDIKALAEAVDDLHGVPHAMYAALLMIEGNGTINTGVAVTFPAGLFVGPPNVQLSVQYYGFLNPAMSSASVTPAGLTVGLYSVDGTITYVGVDYPVHLLAIETRSGAWGPPGRAVLRDATLTTITLTCHTSACLNNGLALSLETIDPTVPGVCGACRQPITDIVRP